MSQLCTMDRLFNKTTQQLRDIFVRAKFGEMTGFWRSDIEEWIEGLLSLPQQGPQNLEAPDVDSWIFYLPMISMSLTLQELLRSASNHHHPLTRDFPMEMRKEPLRTLLLRLLEKQNTGLFLGFRWALIVIPSEIYGEQWYAVSTKTQDQGHEPQCYSFTPFDPQQPSGVVADVLFAEWLNQRQFAKTARQRFLEQMKKIVAAKREKHEDEFNRAVAVTSDGLRILHADRVIVCESDASHLTPQLVFTPEAFRDYKILHLDSRLGRIKIPLASGPCKVFLPRGAQQIFATESFPQPRTMFVARDHVPSEVLHHGIPFDPTQHA